MIERLCGHHSIRGFDCGDDFFNECLRQYSGSVNTGRDGGTIFVLVRRSRREVCGYIATAEYELKQPSGRTERYFLIPALAVDVAHKSPSGSAARLLIRKAIEVGRLRQKDRPRYRGIASIPLTESVHHMLKRRKFRPLPGNELFWWLPFPNGRSS